MEDLGSFKVLDLYIKANDNKNKIVFEKDGKQYSKAEMVVLSCMEIVIREQEDNNSEIDYDKIIKTIVLNSLDGKLDNLKKKDEYNNLIKASKELETEEGYCAKTVYERLLSDFKNYLNPIYNEEKFVNNNLNLHNVTRKGHIYWGVNSNRIENVLEHIYGCLVLSLGLESEYGYKVNFDKIRKMLVIHETGEIIKGDDTKWDMSDEERLVKENRDVISIMSRMPNGFELIKLLDEFNGHITLESEYAYLIDKIEYDMQVKMYEKEGKYDYNNLPNNIVTNSSEIRSIIDHGAQGVFDVHYEYDKEKYNRIPVFRRILNETKNY